MLSTEYCTFGLVIHAFVIMKRADGVVNQCHLYEWQYRTRCELPFCKSSTQCIDYKDVTDMIKYCPESVHFNMGYARCRNGVSPLWAILANRNVEVGKKEKIVQLLLKHGAKYTDTVYVNGRACSIKDDINSWS